MQRIDNLYVSELEFDESGMRGPKGENGDSPSLYIEKIADYIYKAEARDPDRDKAEIFVREHYPTDTTACASIRKGNLFGHNYDRRYDRTAEFVVKTPAKHGVHASIGVAAIPGVLTADMVDMAEPDEETKTAYEVLPFFLTDGINDAGVTVSMHFMQYDNETPADDDHAMCSLFAVKYLMDNAESADDAVRLLRMQDFWFPASETTKHGIYLLIADREKTFVADLYGNRELCENDKIEVLSNFRTIGWDGTKQTLETHANGLERYQIMSDAYESVETEDDIFNLLKSIWYTGVYDTEKEDFWYSDYNGDWSAMHYGDLTINSVPADYRAVIMYASDKFQSRVRDGVTMQTVHTAVYDLENLTLKLMVQETDKIYRFALDGIDLIYREMERAQAAEESVRTQLTGMIQDETDRAVSVETDIREEYIDLIGAEVTRAQTAEGVIRQYVDDTYYTKTEVDGMVSDLGDDIASAVADATTAITQDTDSKLVNKADRPVNNGTPGQVLYRSDVGSEWGNLPAHLPDVTAADNNKVLTVENGEWVASDQFADYIRYTNITVTITSDNGGVSTSGLTVTLKSGDTGDMINNAAYRGQPVTFRVPRGLHFIVEQSGVWEGYHNPTPAMVEGVASNDVSVIFTYEAIRVPTTLRELQIIVNDGNASTLASHIGLQFEDTYTENNTEYNILWDLKDVHDVYDENGQRHVGVFLQWHQCTPTSMPFDAPERELVDLSTTHVAAPGMYYYGLSGTTYTMLNVVAGEELPTTYDALYVNSIRSPEAWIVRRGYGRYSESAVRKWLNSDADENEWFVPTHVGDVAPAQASVIPGFKKGCSDQILSMVKPVRIETASAANTNYQLYDEFFIPSVTEVYGIQDNATEGVAWGDWIDATGFSEPANDACPGRRVYAIGTANAQRIGLRSANVGYQYVVWDINTDGSLDGYASASTMRRLSPCCVIYK